MYSHFTSKDSLQLKLRRVGNEGNGILIRLTVLTYELRFSALAYGISGFKIQMCILRNTMTFEITPSNVTLNVYSASLNFSL